MERAGAPRRMASHVWRRVSMCCHAAHAAHTPNSNCAGYMTRPNRAHQSATGEIANRPAATKPAAVLPETALATKNMEIKLAARRITFGSETATWLSADTRASRTTTNGSGH